MNYYHEMEKTLTTLQQNESQNRNDKKKSKQFRSSMAVEEIILKDMEKQLNLFNTTYNRSSSHNIIEIENNNDNSNKDSQFNSIHDNNLKIINKKTKYIYILHIELLLILFLSLITIVTVIVFYSENQLPDIQDNNGKWRYNCPLKRFNLLSNGVEMAIIFILILKVIKIWNYVFVFKHIKSLGYSLLIWITLGPFIDLISYVSIFNSTSTYILFTYFTGIICYVTILILN
ncbi:hypothetical protein BCR36DRAFT_320492, partial [Piromyces finnis]